MKGAVGVVGLGIMGGAIARNLHARGWRVWGFDANPQRRAEGAAAGLEIAPDVGAVARAAPLLLLSLPHADATRAVAREIADSGAPPRIVAELSTLALDDKRAFADILAPAGHRALDCPLSGTGAQALRRDLVVYASGEKAAVEACAGVFADFANKTAYLGAFGNGSRMKYVANLLVAIHNVAAAEAMTLAMKSGLDPQDVLDVIAPGAGGSRMFDMRAPMMAQNRYEPATMRVSTWMKDMDVIDAFAREAGVATPCFDATRPLYEEALRRGWGEMDTAAVCRVIAERSGYEREPAS